METILIATDFSDAADNAVKYGAELANYFGAEIVLVHAFALPLGGYDNMAPVTTLADLHASSMEKLQKLRKQIIRKNEFDPGIDCVSEVGYPHVVIRDVIKKYNADLLVMGMVGEAGIFKKHFIGSTVLKAVRNLDIPLLIVPEDAKYHGIKNISFACDLDHTEETTTFQVAKYFTKVFGANLNIVHVKNINQDPVVLEKTKTYLEKTLRDVEHQTSILDSEDPAEALELYFKNAHTDLLMLFPKKHNIFDRIIQKGVSRKLLFAVKTPVLIIR
jgi:nucleotide-binding universal stress UspA family protein